MRHAILASIIVFATAPIAWAQTASPPGPELRNAVSGIFGGGQTWDDEGSLGSGVALGVRVDRRLFGTTHGEVALDVMTHDRNVGHFQANGQTTFVSASLVHRFGRGTVQPYVLGGILLAIHDGTVGFSDFPERDVNSTDLGLPLGVGVTVRFRERFELGPEFRILGMWPDDDSNPAMAYWAGARFAYRF